MESLDYQLAATRTAKRINDAYLDGIYKYSDALTEMIFGLVGETGEVVDEIKKVLFHGHNMKRDKMVEELGDVFWYLANLMTVLGINMDEVMRGNIKKLEKRYPVSFSTEKSINRSI
jgi:NTP pyrophosphatase (non-canonical NTP hydrolase)